MSVFFNVESIDFSINCYIFYYIFAIGCVQQRKQLSKRFVGLYF